MGEPIATPSICWYKTPLKRKWQFLTAKQSSFLNSHGFHQTLLDNGIEEISHLQDVKEEDAIGFGLTKFQFRIMQRLRPSVESRNRFVVHV